MPSRISWVRAEGYALKMERCGYTVFFFVIQIMRSLYLNNTEVCKHTLLMCRTALNYQASGTLSMYKKIKTNLQS